MPAGLWIYVASLSAQVTYELSTRSELQVVSRRLTHRWLACAHVGTRLTSESERPSVPTSMFALRPRLVRNMLKLETVRPLVHTDTPLVLGRIDPGAWRRLITEIRCLLDSSYHIHGQIIPTCEEHPEKGLG